MNENNQLDYILFRDNSEASFNVLAVLNFLNSKGIHFLTPKGNIDTNYPEEIADNLPAIYLISHKKYIKGEKKILIFLTYHSGLDCNYITLRNSALKAQQ